MWVMHHPSLKEAQLPLLKAKVEIFICLTDSDFKPLVILMEQTVTRKGILMINLELILPCLEGNEDHIFY
jgi:hypothetical protein